MSKGSTGRVNRGCVEVGHELLMRCETRDHVSVGNKWRVLLQVRLLKGHCRERVDDLLSNVARCNARKGHRASNANCEGR